MSECKHGEVQVHGSRLFCPKCRQWSQWPNEATAGYGLVEPGLALARAVVSYADAAHRAKNDPAAWSGPAQTEWMALTSRAAALLDTEKSESGAQIARLTKALNGVMHADSKAMAKAVAEAALASPPDIAAGAPTE